MADIDLPEVGDSAWGPTLNTAVTAINDQVNDIQEEIDAGTFGASDASVAALVSNPETITSGSVTGLIQDNLEVGAPGLMKILDARDNPSLSRGSWLGSIQWWVDEGDSTPLNYSSAKFDTVLEIAAEPLPFSPADVPGAVGWWDAAMSGLTNGATVSTWENLITSQPDAVAVTGVTTTSPTYDATGLSGHPSISFAEGGALVANGFANLTTPLTLYIYGIITAAASDRVIDARSAADATAIQLRNTSGNWTLYKGNSAVVTGPAVSSAATLFKGVWASGTSVSLELNKSGTPSTGTNSNTVSLAKFAIGGNAGGTGAAITGKVGFIFLVAGTVSSEDQNNLYKWIDSHYGSSFGV